MLLENLPVQVVEAQHDATSRQATLVLSATPVTSVIHILKHHKEWP